MRKTAFFTALLLSVCASGCMMGPDYQKPFFAMPSHWPWEKPVTPPADLTQQDSISRDWWRNFKDPALTSIVEEGLKNNADLLVAAGRVAQARALVTARQAELYPDITVQGGAVRTSNSAEDTIGGFGGSASSKPYNAFSIGAVLDYELDLWGRLRRGTEAARAQLLAAQSTQDAIRLAVSSDIANGYFTLRALDAQLQITANTIKSRQEALHFQQTQFRLGGANGLTFRQAEAELALALAQKPLLEQQRTEQETALAVLTGRSPKEIVEDKIATGKTIDALPTPPVLPDNLPSSLMERRPDIVAAEQDLVAANADIGAAKADYFPRVSLTGLLGLGSSDADRILRSSARSWRAGATLAGPLADFGRTRALVENAVGEKDVALANYGQTVRVAFKEVMDSLSAEKTSAAHEKAQTAQMTARNETVRLSQLRYKSGYSNYLEVLDAQRYLFDAQLDRITAKRDRLSAAVNLYKALGGGWTAPQQPEKK